MERLRKKFKKIEKKVLILGPKKTHLPYFGQNKYFNGSVTFRYLLNPKLLKKNQKKVISQS